MPLPPPPPPTFIAPFLVASPSSTPATTLDSFNNLQLLLWKPYLLSASRYFPLVFFCSLSTPKSENGFRKFELWKMEGSWPRSAI